MSSISITVQTKSGGTQTFSRQTADEDDIVDAINFLEEVDADDDGTSEEDNKDVQANEGGKGGETN